MLMNVSILLFLEAYVILELTCHKWNVSNEQNTDFKEFFQSFRVSFYNSCDHSVCEEWLLFTCFTAHQNVKIKLDSKS